MKTFDPRAVATEMIRDGRNDIDRMAVREYLEEQGVEHARVLVEDVMEAVQSATVLVGWPAAEPTDRQLLVDVRRWAIANGWHWHRTYGWINAPIYQGWTVAVEVLDGQVAVSRQSADQMRGHTDYHRVDSVRQGVDILCALDVLPARFSSAYRAALAAAGPPPLPGELVCAAYPPGSSTQLMIRRIPDGKAHAYLLYVNGAHAYGPYWRSEDAYDRLKRLGGRP